MAVRVLVVGGSDQSVELARQVLVPLECEVSPATSMSLGLYLAHKSLPDLIVAGTELSDGSWLELIAEVKSDRELKEIPFILLAPADEGIKRQALNLGADVFLVVPASGNAFLDKVKPFLKERRIMRPEESPE